ncbi:MAG: type 1 glutamine amidotransferase [Gammaproteobacteria bacterium]
MRIHLFQHVEYNDRAFIPEWAAEQGHELIRVMVPQVSRLPDADDIDALIIAGGPMSVWDVRQHAWLSQEKELLSELLGQDKPVLGICLGAQMIAEHLGATVKPSKHLNIGWYPIVLNPLISTTWITDVLPGQFRSFFWHGDDFELPADAVPLATARSEASQGFVWQRSIGLQFHLEATPEWARHLVTRDGDQLVSGPGVQSAETILSKPVELYRQNNVLMSSLLERWLRRD